MADKKGFDLTSILGDVSKLDTATASGAVTSLPAEQIHANDKNFYDVSNVDTLVDAILLDGLQSPLVVNQRGEGDYVIISGHRRFKALQQIFATGDKIPEGKLFAADINAGRIPCFVNHYSSDLEAELALIRANSDTRVLTSAEISKQAERVEMLLYGLKEQGYIFPGKMRDYVAECCKASTTKLARLKMIREKLIDDWYGDWESGKINESIAYELSRLPANLQIDLVDIFRGKNNKYSFSAYDVTTAGAKWERQRVQECPSGGTCGNFENITHAYAHPGLSCWANCCMDCSQAKVCKFACPGAAEALEKRWKERDAANIAREAERKAKEKKRENEESQNNKRTIDALKSISRDAFNSALDSLPETLTCGSVSYWDEDDWAEMMEDEDFDADSLDTDDLVALAVASGTSFEYLVGVTDDPTPPAAVAADMMATWRTDTDYTQGWCVAQVQMSEGTEPAMKLLYRSSYCWRFARNAAPIDDIDVVAWYPVPERREAQS